MHVQRVTRRNNAVPLLSCGCVGMVAGVVLVLLIGIIFLLPALPRLAAQAAGFTPKGDTQAVFTNVQPAPDIQIQNPASPPDAVLNVNQPDIGPLPADQNFYQVQTGITDTGVSAAAVTFSEANLMDLCRQRTTLCSNSNNQFRNVQIDLRPGGAVVYADVQIPGLPVEQATGVVLKLDSTGRQFEVAGVDIAGSLYGMPSGELGDQVLQVAAAGNTLLQQLELEAGGGQYRLSQVYIDDTALTLLLQ